MPGGSFEGQVPVFVYPTTVTFNLQDESTYKQVLTIYNPYDFSINYLLLSNSPSKYYIPDSSGVLKPRNRVDILIRHSYPILRNVGANDKLRVQITEKGCSKILGKKDVPLVLVESLPARNSSDERETFEKLPHERHHGSSSFPIQEHFGKLRSPGGSNIENWFGVCVATIILCLGVLLMPTDCEESVSSIPPSLHFSVVFKNVASFVLGLVVAAIMIGST